MRNKFVGRLPLSLFFPSAKIIIDERLYKDGGIKPESLFSPTDKTWRELKFPKKGGIPPLRLLVVRARNSSFDKEASSFGIDPERLFAPTLRILMLEQWERFAAILAT